MTRKIFQYLFFFALLIALFFYVNARNQSNFYSDKLERLVNKAERLTDSIAQLTINHQSKAYFSLEGNHDAQSHHQGLSSDFIEGSIEDEILSLNEKSGGNPLLKPLGKDFIINKIQVVNHRWVLADCTDGDRWGDVLMTYNIDPKNKVTLKLIDHVFYP